MIITEEYCDKAFSSIRFSKRNMETTLLEIQSNWVSKLYVYNRSEVDIVCCILNDILHLVSCRRYWNKLSDFNKKRVLGFLYRNKRLFLDNKAFRWTNIEDFSVLVSIGNSYWNVMY